MGKENSQNRASLAIAETPPKKRGTVRETPVKEELPQARSGTTVVGSFVPPKKNSQPMGTPSKNSWASIIDSPIRSTTGATPGKIPENDAGYVRQDIQVKRTFVHYDSPKTSTTVHATPPKSVPHSFKPANPAPVMLFAQHQSVTTQPPTPVVGHFGASPCASPMPMNRHQTSLQPQSSGTTTLRLSDYLPSPVITQGPPPAGQSVGVSQYQQAPDFPNFQVMAAAQPPMSTFPTVPPLPGQQQQCYQPCHQPCMPQGMPVSLDMSLQQAVPQVSQPQPVVMDMSNMGMAIGASIAPLQQSYQINNQYQPTMPNGGYQGQCATTQCMASMQTQQMNGASMQSYASPGGITGPYPDQSMCGIILENQVLPTVPSVGTQIAAPPAGPPAAPACRRGVQGPLLQVPAGPRWSDMEVTHQET